MLRVNEAPDGSDHHHHAEDDAGKKPKAKPKKPPVPLPSLSLSFASSWSGVSIPDREWLVEDLIPTRAVTLFTGHGGVGKSTLIMQLQAAVGSRRGRWLGRECLHVPSIGVYCEDELRELQRRLASICKTMELSISELVETALVSMAGRHDQTLAVVGENGRLVPTPMLEALRQNCLALKARLVIIDGAADVFGGNENDRAQVRAFLGMLRRLALDIDGAVILIAHPSRQGMRDDSGTSGSTHWHNAARSLWYFTRPKYVSGDGDSYTADLRELRHLKNQFGPLADPLHMKWIDGAMMMQERAARAAPVDDAVAEKLFLDTLDQIVAQGRYASDSKNSPNYAPKLIRELTEPPVSVRSMERAMKALFRKGEIRIERVRRLNRHQGPAIVRSGQGAEIGLPSAAEA